MVRLKHHKVLIKRRVRIQLLIQMTKKRMVIRQKKIMMMKIWKMRTDE
jgi:hypothetical protein